jgi:hypothetical protein
MGLRALCALRGSNEQPVGLLRVLGVLCVLCVLLAPSHPDPPERNGLLRSPRRLSTPNDATSGRRYSPVSPAGAATGFDCGEPSSRSQIVSSTSAATERNSLCQFWNDSYQNWLVAR